EPAALPGHPGYRSAETAERVRPGQIVVVGAESTRRARSCRTRLEAHGHHSVPGSLHPPVPVIRVRDIHSRDPRPTRGRVATAVRRAPTGPVRPDAVTNPHVTSRFPGGDRGAWRDRAATDGHRAARRDRVRGGAAPGGRGESGALPRRRTGNGHRVGTVLRAEIEQGLAIVLDEAAAG